MLIEIPFSLNKAYRNYMEQNHNNEFSLRTIVVDIIKQIQIDRFKKIEKDSKTLYKGWI